MNENLGLRSNDKSMILTVFEEIRNNCEKKYIHGKYLEPAGFRLLGSKKSENASDSASEERSAVFFCMPYFSLDQLRPRESVNIISPRSLEHRKTISQHFPRSLHQAHYRQESTERRDKNQVICQINKQIRDALHCIHVPQLWCILLNKGENPVSNHKSWPVAYLERHAHYISANGYYKAGWGLCPERAIFYSE